MCHRSDRSMMWRACILIVYSILLQLLFWRDTPMYICIPLAVGWGVLFYIVAKDVEFMVRDNEEKSIHS